MPKWLGVPQFAQRLAKYDETSYKQILALVDSGALPSMPRYGNERIRIKFCREVLQFLIDRGLEEREIKEFLTGWNGR